MTIIEVRALEVLVHNLPQIAKELKRIADTLEQKKEDTDDESNPT